MNEYTKLVNGVTVAMTSEEIQQRQAEEAKWALEAPIRLAKAIREKRDVLLAACDFRMMPDYLNANRDQWTAYRQALRDLPSQDLTGKTMEDIEWPTAPKD